MTGLASTFVLARSSLRVQVSHVGLIGILSADCLKVCVLLKRSKHFQSTYAFYAVHCNGIPNSVVGIASTRLYL